MATMTLIKPIEKVVRVSLEERASQALQNLLQEGLAAFKDGHFEEALHIINQAKDRWPAEAAKWIIFHSVVLAQLDRLQEADESLKEAYVRRSRFSAEDVRLLYFAAATWSVVLGVSSVQKRWLPDLDAATKTFIKWRERARRDRQSAVFKQVVEEAKAEFSQEDRAALEEFLLSVRLSSIRDPFKAWQALTREISKSWPEGVSAVDAIREQRR